MAIIGQQLLVPEAGWVRIEDSTLFGYMIGTNWQRTTVIGSSGGTSTTGQNMGMCFNFTGTKLRIIGRLSTTNIISGNIIIDNITRTFTQRGTLTIS